MPTDTAASNSHANPLDEGIDPGSMPDNQGTPDSAGWNALLGTGTGTGWKGNGELDLSSLDVNNETVAVGTGKAWLPVSSANVQNGLFAYGADVPSHGDTLPVTIYLPVVVFSSETIDLDTDTDAAVHICIDTDGTGGGNTNEGDVYFRHGSAPSHPSLKIGEADSTSGGNGTDSDFNRGPAIEPYSIAGSLTGDTLITDLVGDGLVVSSGTLKTETRLFDQATEPSSWEDGDWWAKL